MPFRPLMLRPTLLALVVGLAIPLAAMNHAGRPEDLRAFAAAETPGGPGPGDLVVRVEACGICGSDLKAHGHMPGGIVMGHEFCGEVVAVTP